jgi:predicted dinucleotide-binding enzyme
MTTIAILGAGNVARSLAPRLTGAGHHVVIGARDPQRLAYAEWASPGTGVRLAPLTVAAEEGELVINALPGNVSLEVLTSLRAVVAGKVLVDLANANTSGPDGFAVAALYPDSSLAEEIQHALPETKVVKTLNTMYVSVMADPGSLSTPPTAFLSGDDAAAKQSVTALLADLGWPTGWLIDLGDVASARWPETFVRAVRHLVGALGPVPFALAIAR